MKKLLVFISLLLTTGALWYFSMLFFANNFNIQNIAITAENITTISNSLFLALFLAAISFAVILLSMKVNTNQLNFEKSVYSNNIHLELMALSSLIDECDTTLHRYDRWEEAGIKGDYMNAKSSVRDKMNVYRDKLENCYEVIQQMNQDSTLS